MISRDSLRAKRMMGREYESLIFRFSIRLWTSVFVYDEQNINTKKLEYFNHDFFLNHQTNKEV